MDFICYQKRKKPYAAGCLFVTWHDNQIFTLLGKDNYNAFSDFGGKSELIDNNNPMITAARETYEETLGLIMSKNELLQHINSSRCITSQSYTNKPYYMYVVWLKYSDLFSNDFNTIYNYICSVPNINHSFKEKKSISWFKLHDIFNTKPKYNLRNVFFNTIQRHQKHILEIALELKGRNIKNNNERVQFP